MEFWRFLDSWTGHISWKKEEHVALKVSTDASQSRWAAVIHTGSEEMIFEDFNEMWAVAKSLESLPSEIRDCRLDI